MTALAAVGLDFGLGSVLGTLLLELPNSRTQELEGAPALLFPLLPPPPSLPPALTADC